jgi:DNA mismatch repair protein MutS2
LKIYPSNIDNAVGFDEIKKLLASYTATNKAHRRALNLKPKNQIAVIESELDRVVEMGRLLKATSIPNISYVDDIKSEMESMTLEGKIPPLDFLVKIKNLVTDTILFLDFVKDIAASTTALNPLIDSCLLPLRLHSYLIKILDEEGNISPTATPELKEISDSIIRKEKEVRNMLNQKFDLARKNGWAGETEISIRNERLVIPIISEHKKKVKGLVHDVSATGKYLYIEPLECFEENNNLRELYIARKKEIERILRLAGKLLMEEQSSIESVLNFWEELDFVVAKAKLSAMLNAHKPEQSLSPGVKLKEAYHPLLFLKIGERIVKNDVVLSNRNHLLLISGPNAGGKSVLLKTMILLQMMYQSGLCITASPNSELHIFENIICDISDNQSIEDDLSTYSAHLVHMKYLLENSNPNTLLAVDELGTGTDPQLGAPMAEVMLEELWKSGAYGLVSSHLGSLKLLPEKMDGLDNASMQYDPNALKPLFKLIIGRPGNSFAFELAKNLNYPPDIIQKATLKLKNLAKFDYEEMNIKLEKLNYELENTREKLSAKESHLNKLINEYSELKEQIKSAKSQVLKQAREKASEIIAEADLLLQKIKKNRPSDKDSQKIFKDKILEIHQDLQKKSEKEFAIKADKETIPLTEKNVLLKVGDRVLIQPTGQEGEIADIKKNKALVIMGALKTNIELNKLLKLKNQKSSNTSKNTRSSDMLQRQQSFRNVINVVGERGDIATMKIERWLDEAYVLGEKNLKVIHGHGEGILKSLLKELLKTHHGVKSWTYERIEMGGDGATIIQMM